MPSDSKNNHPILGIECPNCGRICALGTKVCPNCHHELKNPKYTLSNQFQRSTTTNGSKYLKLIVIVLLILLTFSMMWLFKNRTINNATVSQYIYVQIRLYDKEKNLLRTNYYVAKQDVSNKRMQYKFMLGFLGQGEKGEKLVRNSDITTMENRFEHIQHYQLAINKRKTFITGPQSITIRKPSSVVLPKDQFKANPTRVPTTELLKCAIKGQQSSYFVKIEPVSISPNS